MLVVNDTLQQKAPPVDKTFDCKTPPNTSEPLFTNDVTMGRRRRHRASPSARTPLRRAVSASSAALASAAAAASLAFPGCFALTSQAALSQDMEGQDQKKTFENCSAATPVLSFHTSLK
jgi:hypothetical protein